ncbi:hypothetical protein H2201_004641 [Coniosporium apollinis]|uniref:SMP domain-containing protein n=2 Tax=Coniosporium TaxID=2810619 RepID=A0ABQ9NSH0_9PEZI|nr:hypothetical protein H2199_006693 [Cladosporium sp. JES 115]KAJ9665349.1 hypothetical protein H2201_004641 [Coniosporium apollinis]
MSSAGTKVTTDPASKNAINEAVGTVASDSLAAESVKSGGSFGEGNPKAGVSSQPGSSSTLANTDTSGARTIPPAPNAGAREAQEGGDATDLLDTGRGQGKAAGKGPTYNTPADEAAAAKRSGETGGKPYNTTTGSGANAGTAPTAISVDQSVKDKSGPHGKNITEGGFDPDLPNASFNNEIGTENDPGRLAEVKLAQQTAQAGGDAGGGPRQTKISNDGQYDVLEETSA